MLEPPLLYEEEGQVLLSLYYRAPNSQVEMKGRMILFWIRRLALHAGESSIGWFVRKNRYPAELSGFPRVRELKNIIWLEKIEINATRLERETPSSRPISSDKFLLIFPRINNSIQIALNSFFNTKNMSIQTRTFIRFRCFYV